MRLSLIMVVGLWCLCVWQCGQCHIPCIWCKPWWKLKLGGVFESIGKMGKWCSPANWDRYHRAFVMLVEMYTELLRHEDGFLGDILFYSPRMIFLLTSTWTFC